MEVDIAKRYSKEHRGNELSQKDERVWQNR